MDKTVLILGLGFLGTNLKNEFIKKNWKVFGTRNSTCSDDIYHLNITDTMSVQNLILKIKPSLIVNCIANNNIDFLETNPEIAYQINSNGPRTVSSFAEKINSKIIHISTDSVFDGKKGMYTEKDTPNPMNIYAKSKLEGENAVIENSSNSVIIRTNFYGIHDNSKYLFNSILAKLQKQEKIVGFNDVIFNPLEIQNLSQLICDISESNFNGLLHLSSNEIITKYEFCYLIAHELGFNTKLIEKGSIDSINFVARRPKNTSLDNTKSKSITHSAIVSFKNWLNTIKNIYDLT